MNAPRVFPIPLRIWVCKCFLIVLEIDSTKRRLYVVVIDAEPRCADVPSSSLSAGSDADGRREAGAGAGAREPGGHISYPAKLRRLLQKDLANKQWRCRGYCSAKAQATEFEMV